MGVAIKRFCQEHEVDQVDCLNRDHVYAQNYPLIKVFEVNEYEWWMGIDPESVLLHYMEVTGCDREEATGDEDGLPVELTADQMDKWVFVGEGYYEGRRTFREQLRLYIEARCEFPGFFATTEY